MESDDIQIERKVTDIVVKAVDTDGKMEITGLRLLIKGTTGSHIVSVFKGETPFCDCLAFNRYKKCSHVAVCDVIKYAINALLPLAEIDKVFEKIKQQT